MAWYAVLILLAVLVALAAGVFVGLALGLLGGRRVRLPSAGRAVVGRGAPGCPVLMYHRVNVKDLRRELEYLRRNGYETIALDRLSAYLRGEDVSLPPRPVVLTFDDGWESLYTAAFPLLKEFGFSATAYVCPALVSSVPPRMWAERREVRFVTWDMLREMDASGVVDVQSHAFDHRRMWVSGHVLDFVRPGMPMPYFSRDANQARELDLEPPLGWPILQDCPRFAEVARFIPDVDVMRRAAEHVERNGGPAFFERAGWRDELCRVLGGRSGACTIGGCRESREETQRALREDLAAGKQEIEQRLGKTVRHLAFPWNEGGSLATALAVQVGYQSIVRGTVNEREVCSLGDDPLYIPRLGCYPAGQGARTLPGRGRRGPLRVVVAMAYAALNHRLRG